MDEHEDDLTVAMRAALNSGDRTAAHPDRLLTAVQARVERRRGRRRALRGVAATGAVAGIVALISLSPLLASAWRSTPSQISSGPRALTDDALLTYRQVNAVIPSQRPPSALQRGPYRPIPALGASYGLCGDPLTDLPSPESSLQQSWIGAVDAQGGTSRVTTTEQVITWPDADSARAYLSAVHRDALDHCRDSEGERRSARLVRPQVVGTGPVLVAPTGQLFVVPTSGSGVTDQTEVHGDWTALAVGRGGDVTATVTVMTLSDDPGVARSTARGAASLASTALTRVEQHR